MSEDKNPSIRYSARAVLDQVPDLDEMDAEKLRAYREELAEAMQRLDLSEPRSERSEAYEQWADEHEELEDLMDEVDDLLDDLRA